MIEAILYKRAWRVLYMVFGEQEREADLKLMDSVMEATQHELEELNGLQNQTTKEV